MPKSLALALVFMLFLSLQACKKTEEQPVPVAPSSAEIIKNYADTLTTAQDKARAASEKAEGRDALEEKAIKELEQ
ncbi:MAG: hypothetical protein A2X93_02935 [Deltaproteobacteria bacterium GWC2_56_8]|nr:MAG: hypothetical protein A2X99_03905 [Deltaproteobacteria bacterium GWB2_55_19]OGP37162.1 MAG: hypothetical protein A2X93_02935 [Deltaproteobacteria bacterium GWC2_56_8]HAO93620.1 hypothetical protein [Deltaproteobacteria bacterium]